MEPGPGGADRGREPSDDELAERLLFRGRERRLSLLGEVLGTFGGLRGAVHGCPSRTHATADHPCRGPHHNATTAHGNGREATPAQRQRGTPAQPGAPRRDPAQDQRADRPCLRLAAHRRRTRRASAADRGSPPSSTRLSPSSRNGSPHASLNRQRRRQRGRRWTGRPPKSRSRPPCVTSTHLHDTEVR